MSRALAFAALLLALLPAAAIAATTPKADLVDLEDEVMCVTCKIPLNIAEGRQPDRQRALIRDLIAQGRTKPQIKQELVAQYGEDVLALPETRGVGITAYAIPLVLGALVVGSLALLVPRWRRRPAAGMAGASGGGAEDACGTTDLSDADSARLDEDLARYDR
ncbi:MAG: cytochrome c-type biogenesis protein CcmH [Actinomycetota bacterium]|nr:cytochrome c-type biogenesis protein CcmH [Actinomycetota bacterium]